MPPSSARGNDVTLLAHMEVGVPRSLFESLPDLGDPDVLAHYRVRPDILTLPRPRRAETQAIARRLWNDSHPGLRWWLSFHGDWHSTVLFVERVPLDRLRFGLPTIATIHDPAVRAGAQAAGMRLRRSSRTGSAG